MFESGAENQYGFTDRLPADVVEANFEAQAVNPRERCDSLLGGIVVTGSAQFAATGKVGTADAW